jgi:hypothetical protein
MCVFVFFLWTWGVRLGGWWWWWWWWWWSSIRVQHTHTKRTGTNNASCSCSRTQVVEPAVPALLSQPARQPQGNLLPLHDPVRAAAVVVDDVGMGRCVLGWGWIGMEWI